jgi:opacity protein-like surface antigen
MNKSLRILIPWLEVIVLLLLPASMQGQEKKYRFEFFGGINAPMDKSYEIGPPQSDFIIQGKHEFSEGGQAGVRFGIDGARYWGQDYAYSYGSNAGTITTSAGNFSFPTRFHQVSSNLLFYPWSLDRRQFFPYVTAGVGATFVIVSQDTLTEALHAGMGQLESETVFAFNAGAGVRIRINDRTGLRLDWRDFMSRALRYGMPKSSDKTEDIVMPAGGVAHQFAGTVAFVVHF